MKAAGLSDEQIAAVYGSMNISIKKSDIDIEREAIVSLPKEKIMDIMTWFANVPYKSKWSFTLAIYRRHWSFDKVSKEFTSSDGEKRIITDKVYKPTESELMTSWNKMVETDIARNVYKDYVKSDQFALNGDDRYSKSVAISNTRA
jgi:hypothetical protein